MRSWRFLPVLIAAVVGVLLGAGLYLVRPLHLTASGATSPEPTTSPTTAASPKHAAKPSATPRVPSGPAFSQRALLQSNEFIQYKWAKADELSLTTGVSDQPIVRCLRPDKIKSKPVAAYAATHHGLTTLAGEQVVRYYSVADAQKSFDQLAGEVSDCGDQDPARRAKVGKRHDPDLAGISETRWWNITGATKGDPMRGVLAIMRVNDRLMALCLTANATDPAKTTDIIPLMRQGGLRMV